MRSTEFHLRGSDSVLKSRSPAVVEWAEVSGLVSGLLGLVL